MSGTDSLIDKSFSHYRIVYREALSDQQPKSCCIDRL